MQPDVSSVMQDSSSYFALLLPVVIAKSFGRAS